MINVVVLPGFVYLALLFVLLFLAVGITLMAFTLGKIKYYIQMTGIDVGNSMMVTRASEKKLLEKLNKNNHSDTTRLIYIKGQLDRVLNHQVINREKLTK